MCAWGYAALLGFVILTGYIPAFIDANDMIFGLFRRTWYADGLHPVSALWAATAALTSRRASELFFSCSASSTSPIAPDTTKLDIKDTTELFHWSLMPNPAFAASA